MYKYLKICINNKKPTYSHIYANLELVIITHNS